MVVAKQPKAFASTTFNGVKVFAATTFVQRQQAGDVVTEWLAAHPSLQVRDIVVGQSSDSEYHCITITVFYWERLPAR
jgi:hypothetical protein